PGYFDERAEGFDAAAARALGSADTAALTALDEELAADLQASGRACWQVLAGAAQGADPHGELLHEEAPYGAGYFVVAWSPAPSDGPPLPPGSLRHRNRENIPITAPKHLSATHAGEIHHSPERPIAPPAGAGCAPALGTSNRQRGHTWPVTSLVRDRGVMF